LKNIRIIAHRSGPKSYPEQTVASAKEALALGADLIEIDVRLTSDGKIAITHDESLERVFGVKAKVWELKSEEFKAIRHKNDPEYSSHMLSDYLESGIAPLLIHIKYAGLIPELIKELIDYGYIDKAVLGVSSLEEVECARACYKNVKLLSFAPFDVYPDMIKAGVDYIRLWESWLFPDTVEKVKQSSAELWVMSGNCNGYPVGEPSDEGLKRILDYQPDGILINDVERLTKLLNK